MTAPRIRRGPKKADKTRFWLLVGGGSAAVLLLVVSGGVLWFLLSRGEPVAENKTAKKTLVQPKEKTHAIKLFVAPKNGDRREVKVVEEIKGGVTLIDAVNPSPEFLADLAKGVLDVTCTINAVVKTLETDARGMESAVELTILQAEMVSKVKNEKFPDVPPVPAGTVVIGKRDKKGKLSWSSPNGEPLPALGIMDLSDVLADDYIGWPDCDSDAVVGASELQPVGGAWQLRKATEVGNHIKSNGFMGGVPGLVSSNTTGTAKLVKVSSDGSDDWQDIEIGVKSSMQQEGKSTTVQFQWNVRVPGDGSTGPVKKTCKAKFDTISPLSPKLASNMGSSAKLKESLAATITQEIKYGLPPGPSSPPAPVTAKPRVLLDEFKVAWVDGKAVLNVAGKYSFKDGFQPKPGADYLLLVSFRYENAASKAYIAQAIAGPELKPDGQFTNPSLAIANVPPMPSKCDLFLMEKIVGSDSQTAIAQLQGIPVSGVPPSATPAPTGPVKSAVELTNGSVQQVGNKVRVTVDYRFTAGKPDPKKTYRLQVSVESGKATKTQIEAYNVKGDKFDFKATLVSKDLAAAVSAGKKFEMWITEDGSTDPQSNAISDKFTGKVTVSLADVMPTKVQFQVAAAATKIKGQKGQPQVVNIQVQWALKTGQLNPQATYTCVMVANGNAVPLTGPANPFQATGTFSQAIPYSGPTTYQFYVIEQVTGQTATTVSNVQNANVK